jgi:archaellum biogenesis ATPase FlaH
MKTFSDLEFIELDQYMDGVAARIMFENGYGVSVVCHSFSYGGKNGLYEVAVLDTDGEITYETDVTDDVIGHLTPEQVTETMAFIQVL